MVLRTTRRRTVTTPYQLRMIDQETSDTLTRRTPPIPPGLTADDARRIAAAVGASRAENTVKNYTRAFRAFAACQWRRHVGPLGRSVSGRREPSCLCGRVRLAEKLNLSCITPKCRFHLGFSLVCNQASRDYAKQVGTPPLRFDPIPASCRSGHAFPPVRTGFSHRIHPS